MGDPPVLECWANGISLRHCLRDELLNGESSWDMGQEMLWASVENSFPQQPQLSPASSPVLTSYVLLPCLPPPLLFVPRKQHARVFSLGIWGM